MGRRGKRNTATGELPNVDEILKAAEARRAGSSSLARTGLRNLDEDWWYPGHPIYRQKTPDEIREEANIARLREMPIGTEDHPHNRVTSARQRKAGRAAAAAAKTANKASRRGRS